MERPSTTDESFKRFLDDLQKQNNRSFATQLLTLKYEKENSDDDNDRREEQLNELISSFQKLEKAVTGFNVKFDVQPIVDSLENSNKILLKQLEELSLTRKLTEGSVEYDKGMAQYRNTSGRDVENLVSGKVSKTGQVIDFETASDRLTGQGKRAREANKLDLTPIEIAPGKKTTEALVPGKEDKEEKRLTGVEIKPDDRTWSEFGKDILSIPATLGKEFRALFGMKPPEKEPYSATKGRYAEEFVKAGKGTEEEGMADYDRRIKEEKEADQAKMFGFESKKKDGVPIEPAAGFEPIEDPEFIEKIKSSADIKNAPGAELKPTPAEANPESDNIESPAEIQNKMVKEDLELTKQSKTIFEQQLFELRAIREALGGSKPSGKGESGAKPQAAVAEKEKEEDSGPGLLDMLPGKGTLGKIGKGAAALGSKAVKFLSGKGGAVLGGALAVGAGAYTAYKGYSAAEESKQAKMEQIQSQLDSGEIDEKQAASLRKEAGNTATVEKSSAVGEGTGMAAGGIAGMKAGAMIGTAFGGPIGTVVGGAIGGAAGMFLGSKAGKAVGGVVGKGINAAKSLGEGISNWYSEKKAQISDSYSRGISGSLEFQDKDKEIEKRAKEAGIIDEKGEITDFEKYSQINQQVTKEVLAKDPNANKLSDVSVGSKQSLVTKERNNKEGYYSSSELKEGITSEKSILGSKTLGALFSKKGLETGRFLASRDSSYETGESGVQQNRSQVLGKRISSGSLFKSDTYKVRGTDEEEVEVSKGDYFKLQKLAKEGKSDEATALLGKIKAAKAEAAAPAAVDAMGNQTGMSAATAEPTGPRLLNTSTENQAMRDQAATSQPSSNTVVNNVSGGGSAPNFIPMKASPRPDSSLNRYQDRVAAY